MPSLHDTRVLENLIKAEKTAEASFKAYTKDAASAASALSAWSVADSGDTQDLMDVSIRISQLIAAVTESQRAYASALHTYRVSLKDVLQREQSLKTVVRDREILVGKLMKLGNKKPNDSAVQSHQAKLDDAQRELTACETYLQDEEIALSHAKRQSFKVALAERMVSLGELGRVMDESAHEAHDLLSSLGGDELPFVAHEHEAEDDGSDEDSITPSHSASQAMSRASSSSRDEHIVPAAARPPSRSQANGSTSVIRAASPRPLPTSNTSAAPPDRLISRQSTIRAPPPAPRPILGPVPTAPRPVSTYLATQEPGNLIPSFDIPKAPANVSSRRPTDDSSDEEDTREFNAHTTGVPRAQRSAHYPYDGPASPKAASAVGHGRLRRRAESDTSSFVGGSNSKRRGSFFGGLASLFRKKERRVDDSAARQSVMGSSAWDTRIDRNVYTSQKHAGRTPSVVAPNRLRPGNDSSDDDATPKNVVRVVNDPKLRQKAMSDIGRSKTPSLHTVTTNTKKTKRAGKASSDIGFAHSSAPSHRMSTATFAPPPVPQLPSSTAPSIHAGETTSIKKKNKKASSTDVPATIVLSAEKLGIPANAAANNPVRSSKLSRSNTVTSNATVTTTTGTVKKKKKKAVADGEQSPDSNNGAFSSMPTAADLASTLPSAKKSKVDTLTAPLPLPNGVSTTSVGATDAARASSPAPHWPIGAAAGKVPKGLTDGAKKIKKEQALHGTSTWVSQPTASKKAGHVAEGEESLMSVVDRAEAQAIAEPSRKYGSGTSTPTPATTNGAIPRQTLSSAGTETTLTKRKSVRLAEGGGAQTQPLSSPASSIRSGQGAAPRHGILVNHTPSPAQALLNADSAANGASAGSDAGAVGGWSTRAAAKDGDDSSDEDDDAVAYRKARKAFVKAGKAKETSA